MSFIKSIKTMFSNSNSELEGHWNRLADEQQIEEIIQQSRQKPQLIYKHSYRCGVCAFSKSELDSAAVTVTSQADMYFVDVINSRKVSNKIAEEFGVRHESPQVLLLVDGEVAWHKSHGSIKADSLISSLKQT